MKRIFLFLLLSFGIVVYFSQCKKNNPQPSIPPNTTNYKLLLTNEGTFGKGTAELSLLSLDNFITNNLFSDNNGRPLGDVAQSITIINNEIYVCLNNSGKIEVMDLSFKSLATITAPNGTQFSPEYIVAINDSLAAVSDLYRTSIAIINTKNHTFRKTIEVELSSQQMVKIGNKLFVVTAVNDYPKPPAPKITIIPLNDVNNLSKGSQIDIGDISNNSKIIVDRNNNLWALTTTGIVCINPTTETQVRTIPFSNISVASFGGRLESNFTKDSLFFNGADKNTQKKGIYALSINAMNEPTTPIFVYDEKIQNFYNFGVSREKTIFICDALDFVQRGHLYEFMQNGTQVNDFLVGVIPQYIYFF